jgi:hypothetical protein
MSVCRLQNSLVATTSCLRRSSRLAACVSACFDQPAHLQKRGMATHGPFTPPLPHTSFLAYQSACELPTCLLIFFLAGDFFNAQAKICRASKSSWSSYYSPHSKKQTQPAISATRTRRKKAARIASRGSPSGFNIRRRMSR